MKRLLLLLIFCGIMLVVVACAGGVSKQARSRVTFSGAFGDVLSTPDFYRGETVMWGGKVIEINNKGGLTEMVVLQLPLDKKYRPTDDDQSRGRFLIRTDQFLDPVIYPPGTLITVVGRLQGTENHLIGEMSYRYPVIDVVELQKYDPQLKSSPRVHIGIGIGGTF